MTLRAKMPPATSRTIEKATCATTSERRSQSRDEPRDGASPESFKDGVTFGWLACRGRREAEQEDGGC